MVKNTTKKSSSVNKSNDTMSKVILFLICFFGGWLGLDKIYVGGTKAWKVALIKFALMFCVVGEVWNIFDMICVIQGKYKLNPIK